MHYSKAEWSTFNSTTGIAHWWQSRDLDLVLPLLGDNLPDQRTALVNALYFLLGKAETRVPYLPRQSRAQLKSFNRANLTIKEFRVVQQWATREKYTMVMARFFQFLLASFKYQVSHYFILYIYSLLTTL